MKRYLPGPTKSLAATTAETIRWSENETLNGSAIRELIFIFTGTDNDVDTITSFSIFAGGDLIFNLDETEIAQFLSVLGKRSLAAGSATWFSIPFDWMDSLCALPPDKALRVELAKDNTGAAGTLTLYYGVDTVKPANCWPMFLASAAGVPASATEYNVPITQAGFLKGLLVPDTADVTGMKLYMGGELFWDFNSSGALLASQDILSGVATTSGKKFLQLDQPMPVVQGSRLSVNSAAGFGGAAERFGLLTLRPY
jgi:hypothetical protein